MDQLPMEVSGPCVSRVKRRGWACATLLALIVMAPAALAGSGKQWQEERLFHPTDAQLQSEQDQRVFIYDRLPDKVVDRAVDEEFNRVENMMFTNTVITDEGGDPVRDAQSGDSEEEDDGC